MQRNWIQYATVKRRVASSSRSGEGAYERYVTEPQPIQYDAVKRRDASKTRRSEYADRSVLSVRD